MTADADAWFEESNTQSNKGDDSALKVKSKLGNDASRALVRLPLPAIPAGCTIQTAQLRLFADGAKPDRTIQVQRAAAAWGEREVNWANQPATTGPIATAASGSDNGWRTWTVTAQVADMYATGQAHGFLVRDAVEDQDSEQTYNSREKGENVPTLVITFQPAG